MPRASLCPRQKACRRLTRHSLFPPAKVAVGCRRRKAKDRRANESQMRREWLASNHRQRVCPKGRASEASSTSGAVSRRGPGVLDCPRSWPPKMKEQKKLADLLILPLHSRRPCHWTGNSRLCLVLHCPARQPTLGVTALAWLASCDSTR